MGDRGWLNLGFIVKAGPEPKLLHHRSLLNVMVNPVLRMFGFHIVSVFDVDEMLEGRRQARPFERLDPRLVIGRCKRKPVVESLRGIRYPLDPGEMVVRRRRLF